MQIVKKTMNKINYFGNYDNNKKNIDQWFWYVWIVIIIPLIRKWDIEMMVQVDDHFDDAMTMKMMAKNRHCSQSDPVGFIPF